MFFPTLQTPKPPHNTNSRTSYVTRSVGNADTGRASASVCESQAAANTTTNTTTKKEWGAKLLMRKNKTTYGLKNRQMSNVFDYTKIQHAARNYLGLNLNEYCVLDFIYKSQSNLKHSNGGWCDHSYKDIAYHLCFPVTSVKSICKRMEKKGLFDIIGNAQKRATKLFYEVAYLSAKQIEELKKIGRNSSSASDEIRPASDEIRPASDEIRPASDEIRPAIGRNSSNYINLNINLNKTKLELKEKQSLAHAEFEKLNKFENLQSPPGCGAPPQFDGVRGPDSEAGKTVLLHLNETAGKNYKTDKSNLSPILETLKAGWTIEECKKVIEVKYLEWRNTKLEQYLRPRTLFGEKFGDYLQFALSAQKNNKVQNELINGKSKTNGHQFDTVKSGIRSQLFGSSL